MTFTFLYVTAENTLEAQQISRHLLQKKLIACANLFPVESVYKWKGKMVEAGEAVLILKTLKNKVEKIKKEIEKIHSYKIPCLTEIEVNPNEQYGKWLLEQFKDKD